MLLFSVQVDVGRKSREWRVERVMRGDWRVMGVERRVMRGEW